MELSVATMLKTFDLCMNGSLLPTQKSTLGGQLGIYQNLRLDGKFQHKTYQRLSLSQSYQETYGGQMG
jgi:hypothetical protein